VRRGMSQPLDVGHLRALFWGFAIGFFGHMGLGNFSASLCFAQNDTK
jgi:hypothetical protein